MGVLRAKVAGSWEDIGVEGVAADPGDIEATIAASAPVGWLLFGRTYTGADAAYPALWAVAPAAWKVGSDLVLPDTMDCTMMGGGALGSVGGVNSLTLATANLPVHAHTLAHTHANNHDHANFNQVGESGSDMSHQHDVNQDNAAGGVGGILCRGAVQAWSTTGLMTVTGAHTHTFTLNIDLANYVGTSGVSSAANTGNSTGGTALAVDITPKALRVNWIIKT